FIDDGLMRENEPQDVASIFGGLGIRVEVVDARKAFFRALKGKLDPEDKRKAFRQTFYEVFGAAVKKSKCRFLIQGTIAADIIETKGGVKTQHNILEQIGINPEKGFGFKVIEPIQELFKPDVRRLAKALELPKSVYRRMPFPGPGLMTRVLGAVTPERVAVVRRATRIVEDEILSRRPFQAFAVLLDDKGTGVEDGKRKFGEIVIIRSVESKNAMTARASRVPWRRLRKMAKRITTEIPSVTRVCYELTGKPPATIEYI
ncbi:MAG: ExsB family transcriptional regulator, partial [Candidatus Aminicenantes bacterium]|nr:ExsB family transcriptional regulator [Candidatus Aminicenantes bacterium]